MRAIERMMSTTKDENEAATTSQATCVEACFAAEAACIVCADASRLEAESAVLRRCIRVTLDTADVCAATGRLVARALDEDTDVLRVMLDACARACASCAAQCVCCGRTHEHAQVCAEICQRCHESCRNVLRSLGA